MGVVFSTAEKKHVPRPPRRTKGGRMQIVKQFFRILRKLRFGTTIKDIYQDEGISRRTAYRWIQVIDEMFGLERIPSDRYGALWTYRINRDKIRERL